MRSYQHHVENLRTYREPGLRVDRSSAFGNPFVIGRDGDRKAVIERFRVWFYLPEQAGLRAEVLEHVGAEDTLLCWCAPQACHAEVLAEYCWTARH